MDAGVYVKVAEVERKHWWYLARQKIIKTRMRQLIKNNSRLLDVGCGTGALTETLNEFGAAIGCDSSEDALALCRTTSSCPVLATKELLGHTELHGLFDAICFFDVIEHAENDRALVEDFLPFLRDGGLIVVTVPAFSFFWGQHDVVSRHFRRYTRGGVEALMRDCALESVSGTYFNFFLSPLMLISRLLERLFPSKKPTGDLELGHSLINRLLYGIFGTEARLLRSFDLPFGVSFFGAYRKTVRSD